MKNTIYALAIVAWSLALAGCATTNSETSESVGNYSVVELENQLKFRVPESFDVTTGPKTLNVSNYNDKQPILAIFDKPKQIVCQVAVNVYATDPGDEIALRQTLDDYKSMDMDAVKEINGNPAKVEAITSYTQSSGTDLTFVTHAYYLKPVKTAAKKAQLYQVLCGTETASFATHEPLIRQILNSIEWI